MSRQIYNWIWKWHFIGGIVSLPIVLVLSISGMIYLFKADYEKAGIEKITKVTTNQDALSHQDQWQIAKVKWNKKPEAIVLNLNNKRATEFTSGRFSHKSKFFLDPYTGKETGRININQTDMHKIRKLHGELLLGSFGAKIVELVACWIVVLLISGMYLFWPKDRGVIAFFKVRTKQSKRTFFRDVHAVTGFWFSLLLLLVLSGGLPWTDIFGNGYKWIQKTTASGFPNTWNSQSLNSIAQGETLPLDAFVKKAVQMNLSGEVSIHVPNSPTGVFSISNQTSELTKMKTFHFDQYSGELIKSHSWEDIGLMMKSRLWLMAFHQGNFGTWNFVLVLLTAFALFVLSLSAMLSYIKRTSKGNWGIPPSPKSVNLGVGVAAVIVVLGLILPLFGLSLMLILLISLFNTKRKSAEVS